MKSLKRQDRNDGKMLEDLKNRKKMKKSANLKCLQRNKCTCGLWLVLNIAVLSTLKSGLGKALLFFKPTARWREKAISSFAIFQGVNHSFCSFCKE